jgi:thiol-disulfide isomerase/thioredoxin
MELKESELLDLIKTNKKIVLKVFTNNCPHCVTYAPVFDAASKKHSDIIFRSLNLHDLPKRGSQFKRLYMMLDGTKEKADVPATIIFENGEMKARKWGRMDEKSLEEFLVGGTVDDPKPDYNMELMNAFAQKGRIITICEDFQNQIDALMKEMPALNAKIQELNKILLGVK